MLDRDLAKMYGVETKRLNESVRRNIDRFPEDFMFELTNEECNLLENSSRSQIATLKRGSNLNHLFPSTITSSTEEVLIYNINFFIFCPFLQNASTKGPASALE